MKNTKHSIPWFYELLEIGECELIDFKEQLTDKLIFGKSQKSFSSNYEEMSKDVVAFANYKGGFIIVGISDKEKEINRDFLINDQQIFSLVQNIQSRTNPSITVIPVRLKVDKIDLLVLEIPFSTQLYCTTKGEYLIRDTDGNRIIHPHEIATIQAEKNLLIYDQKAWHLNYNWDDIERARSLWRKISNSNPKSGFLKKDKEEFKEILGLTKEIDNVKHPTTSGILFIGNDSALREIPYNYIKYVRYFSDGTYTPYEYKGDLIKIADDAFQQLKSEIKVQEFQFGLFRDFVEDYPETAIRELLINAIAHRDYSRQQIIEIRKYDDYLEIESPGSFPEGVTPENCLWKSNPRNPTIMDIFREINYAEKSGSGFDKIFRALLTKGKQLPVFEITGHSVKVKIFSAVFEKGLIELAHHYRQLKGEDIDLEKVLVLNSIIQKRKLKFNELVKLPYINENLLKKILDELLNLDFIETTGKTSDYFYMIHKSRLTSVQDKRNYILSKKVEKQKQQEIILRFLDDFGEIDNSKAREILNIPENQAYLVSKLFNGMLKKGLIYVDREPRFRNRIYKLKK
ncbi:MAG: ATP-binding protein [Ignavibacteriaceae bacterium]